MNGGKSASRGGGSWLDRRGPAVFLTGMVGVLFVAAGLWTWHVPPQEAWRQAQGWPAIAWHWVARAGDKVQESRCALGTCDDQPVTGARPADAEGPYKVTRVTDGDTIHVDVGGKNTTIRTLGDDTPETHDPRKPVQCYGPEASAAAKALLTGKQVYLEYDTTQGRTDKYGRTLAYVWVGGSIYEATMLREGYAHEYTYDKPYRRQAQFRIAQTQAKTAGRGLWSPKTCNGDTTQPEPAGGFS